MFTSDAGYEHLTKRIIGCAVAVHNVFGAGLLESVYKLCLVFELRQAGLRVDPERTIPLIYKGHPLGANYRSDLIVEGTVLIEVKAVAELTAVHTAQVMTYLKLTNCPVGLVINFNTMLVTHGVRRVEHPTLYSKRKPTQRQTKDDPTGS